MLVHWIMWSNCPFETTPKIGVHRLPAPHIFVAGVLLTYLPNHFLLSTRKRTQVIPSPLPVIRNPLPLASTHVYKNLDLQFSLVIFNYDKSLGLDIRKLSVFLIDLFKFSLSCLIMLQTAWTSRHNYFIV